MLCFVNLATTSLVDKVRNPRLIIKIVQYPSTWFLHGETLITSDNNTIPVGSCACVVQSYILLYTLSTLAFYRVRDLQYDK